MGKIIQYGKNIYHTNTLLLEMKCPFLETLNAKTELINLNEQFSKIVAYRREEIGHLTDRERQQRVGGFEKKI